MRTRNVVATGLTAIVLVLGGALAAQAATTGTVSITQGVGSFSGTYAYGAATGNPGQTGIRYSGVLRSTSSQKVSFKAQVAGYGYSGLATVTNGSAQYNKVIYDGAGLYVTTSKAQVCEVQKVLWTDVCTTKTYNK